MTRSNATSLPLSISRTLGVWLLVGAACTSDGADAGGFDSETTTDAPSTGATDSSAGADDSATTDPSTASSSADDRGADSDSDGDDSTSSIDPSSTSGASAASDSGTEDSSACEDTTLDPTNCGRCGNVCPAPSHGEAVCESGSCAVECDGGYHAVDIGGETRCSMFAGFFLLRETQECEAANPLTGDCTCPQGFDDRPVSSWRVEPGDGASWVQLAVCSPVAGTPQDSWGGLYAQYEDTGSCAFPNPLDVPLCACAAGYSVTSQWLGSNINGDAIRVSFCTAPPFDGDDLFVGGFTEACNGGCAAGGSCACPPGATPIEYPSVIDGCATTSTWCVQE